MVDLAPSPTETIRLSLWCAWEESTLHLPDKGSGALVELQAPIQVIATGGDGQRVGQVLTGVLRVQRL